VLEHYIFQGLPEKAHLIIFPAPLKTVAPMITSRPIHTALQCYNIYSMVIINIF
jgi:hypothetical protein